jgi:hypothetical protein
MSVVHVYANGDLKYFDTGNDQERAARKNVRVSKTLDNN